MCGICGIVQRDPTDSVSASRLLEMRAALFHRGPDDAGLMVESGVGLASRRLSILDLSVRGRMPMTSADGRYTIVYNGEIYNFQTLRRSLERNGRHYFRSRTDTEVVLELFAARGPAALEELHGMFAFAIWDRLDRSLFLARDRLGIKPLYFAEGPEGLSFASEEKALFAAGIDATFDHETWPELLCFRYVAGERTPFKSIKRVLPGHYLVYRHGQSEVRRWWNLGQRLTENIIGPPIGPPEWFRETFDASVRDHLISDVPVGVLLSGGLDSTSVARSIQPTNGQSLAGFTVRFSETGFDEGPLAREVAQAAGLEWYDLTVPDTQLLDLLREASHFNDEPLAHGNDLHILAISRYARQRVTVLLSGEGGDETLGGYVRYQPLRFPRALELGQATGLGGLPHLLGLGRARKLARFLSLGSTDRFVLFNACELLPHELPLLPETNLDFSYRERILAEARAAYPEEPVRQAMYSDLHTFLCSILDRNDRMTMGASIECRVPFLDVRLVEGLAATPSSVLFAGGNGKALLRAAIGSRLPSSVRRHKKWGFGVPWARYLRRVPDLRELVSSLPRLTPILDGPFDQRAIRQNVDAFLQGDDRPAALIRQLVMVSVWHEVTIDAVQQA